jgi:hypothetical protein
MPLIKRAAAIGCALAALGELRNAAMGLPLLFGVSRDRGHVRRRGFSRPWCGLSTPLAPSLMRSFAAL